jgi:hypothetical protein
MSSPESVTTAGDAPLEEDEGPGINVVGLISMIVFYLIVLAIGVFAGWKQRKDLKATGTSHDQETVMLAGRNIGIFVGILTMGGNKIK